MVRTGFVCPEGPGLLSAWQSPLEGFECLQMHQQISSLWQQVVDAGHTGVRFRQIQSKCLKPGTEIRSKFCETNELFPGLDSVLVLWRA